MSEPGEATPEEQRLLAEAIKTLAVLTPPQHARRRAVAMKPSDRHILVRQFPVVGIVLIATDQEIQ